MSRLIYALSHILTIKHARLSSLAGCYQVYASIECSREIDQIHGLIWASADGICDKFLNLINKPIWCMYIVL